MAFFGRLFGHLVGDAAIDKLANSSLMRTVAAKVVEMEKHVAAHAEQAVKDPAAARAAVSDQAGMVWGHLKKRALGDFDRLAGRGQNGKKRGSGDA